jgi:hypothetical protein
LSSALDRFLRNPAARHAVVFSVHRFWSSTSHAIRTPDARIHDVDGCGHIGVSTLG